MRKLLILVFALVGFTSQAQEFDFNCIDNDLILHIASLDDSDITELDLGPWVHNRTFAPATSDGTMTGPRFFINNNNRWPNRSDFVDAIFLVDNSGTGNTINWIVFEYSEDWELRVEGPWSSDSEFISAFNSALIDLGLYVDFSIYQELTSWYVTGTFNPRVEINITEDESLLASKLVGRGRFGASSPYKYRFQLFDDGENSARTGYFMDFFEVDNSFRIYNGSAYEDDIEIASSLASQDILDAITNILERNRTEFGY